MYTYVKKLTACLLLIAMIASLVPAVEAASVGKTDELGKLVDSYASNSDIFTLNTNSRLFVVSDTEPTGSLLQTVQLLQRQFAADSRPYAEPMPLIWGPESWANPGDIVICLDTSAGIGEDGYCLEVTEIATVIAGDVDGLLYGGNMLLKHLRNANSNTVQGFTCADTPDTAQRAVSLDCGRKYYTKNWICNLIREMSWMGYNTLELHFSDDSGFRLDLWDEAYYTEDYQPANDFSWICGSNYTSWTLSAYKNDPDKGKFLTTAEVVEILNTAKEYHIDVIPAFDSPSHVDYLTWTYEQNYKSNSSYSFYSTYDSKTYYAKDVKGIINYTNSSGWSTPLRWPYYSTINIVDDHAKAFIFELYLDIADFFKAYSGSTDFSIGADEVNLNTANLASGYSFTWGFPDFVDYINELNQLLNRKGYTMRMYNDFMGSTTYKASNYDFADNIEILYWDSPFEPNSGGSGTKTEPVSYYVNQGSVLYNCIQTNTYYALRITGSGSDARSVYNRQWTFYHANEEDIYNEWYPADISEHGDYSEDAPDVPSENLGGAYFLIWCDYSCVSTEVQIWNGCYDATTQNTGEFYSLRDRMWSNTMKMWNWDIDETVSYSTFAGLRDAYGDFPGCGTGTNACSEKTVLPAATSISSGYVGGCNEYACYSQVRVLSDAPIMTLPCTSDAEASSTILETAYSQELYTAVGLYECEQGDLWYKVTTRTGKIGYLNAEDTAFVEVLTDDITLTGATVPSGHIQGQDFAVRGDIRSHYNALSVISVAVHDGLGMQGAAITDAQVTVSENEVSLLNNISFATVPLGEHTYTICADYESYYVKDGQIIQHTDSICLLEKCFLVLQTEVKQETCSHSYHSAIVHPAGCDTTGERVYLCNLCGHVYEEEIAATGHTYSQTILPATCIDYEMTRYLCTVCGDCYATYSESIYSKWQDTKLEGIDESLLQSKVVYRHSDYETLTSHEPTMEGYEQLDCTLEKTATNSISYVNSWPSGFNKSSAIYTQYNNAASKVTASETETSKRVVDSDVVSGYLYYHWCYGNSYYSMSYKTGSYTTFHAYHSTVDPSNYTCDYSDMSYRTAHSTCSNSQWFFVTTVYTQTYSDYAKLYRYGHWTDWSDWSDTPITANDTCKVETKRLYRYVNAELGSHQWMNGACTVCNETCSHSWRDGQCEICQLLCAHQWSEGVCTQCQKACIHSWQDGTCIECAVNCGHPEWQTTVTAPTCTEPGFTTYTCACGVSYTGDETPATGHSYVDGICSVCTQPCDHNWLDGQCEICQLLCTHQWSEGVCTQCQKACIHSWQDGACTECAVNCGHPEWQTTVTAPTCTEPGFTTYTCICGVSYTGDETPATGHSYVDGVCSVCTQPCDHSWLDGQCEICQLQCTHQWSEGVCTQCQKACIHSWQDGACTECAVNCGHPEWQTTVTAPTCTEPGFTTYTCICGVSYTGDETPATGHSYVDGVCSVCTQPCDHSWLDGQCEICQLQCTHQWSEGVCTQCQKACVHSWQDGACTECAVNCGHPEWQTAVTTPTCTEPGFTTYTCICGVSYTGDATPATGHSYTDGICIGCGEAEPIILPSVKLRYPTLSFEDEVKIHVFFNAENIDRAEEIGLIVYSQEVTSWSIETAESIVPGYQKTQDAGLYFCSTKGIHAKALGDRLYFSIYIKTNDGQYLYSALRNYCPTDYAYNHLAKPENSVEVKSLVVAMLNYGAAAQQYFDYHCDNLVNANLTAEQKALVTDYDPSMITPLQPVLAAKNGDFASVKGSFTKRRPAVSFKGAFAIEYFFTPAYVPEGEVQLYYWDQKTYDSVDTCSAQNATGILTMTLKDDGQYHATVEGISAKDLDQTVFAAAVYSDGTTNYCSGILNYHIGAYCSSFASYENDAQELAAQTAVYGYYAKAYFGS